MTMSAANCQKTAEVQGYKSIIYTPDDIDKDFRQQNKEILSEPIGAGLWLWKPYVILKALKEIGGVVFYTDAGVSINSPVEMHDTTLYVHDVCIHGDWCKMDTIIYMDSQDHIYKKQLHATFMALRCNEFNLNFVSEWLSYCQIKDLIDDTPSKANNIPTFKHHRYDQAILTNLAYKYNLTLYRPPPGLHKHGRRNPGMGENCRENNFEKRREW